MLYILIAFQMIRNIQVHTWLTITVPDLSNPAEKVEDYFQYL